jgi:DNA primase
MARHNIVSSGTAVVVEGYTDCIMAHQFGCSNVVATLGTSFTTGHARLLKRFAKKVILVFDNDTAGKSASNRALEVCIEQKIDIKIAFVEEGKDPCDYLLSQGREGFERLLENACDVFDFKWDRLKETFDSDDTLVGRKQAVQEFIQTIAASLNTGVISPIENGLIVNRLSKTTGMQQQEILAELDKYSRRNKRSKMHGQKNETENNIDLGSGISAAAQREIIEVLLNYPKYMKFAAANLTADAFDVPVLKGIFEILSNLYKKQQDDNIALNRITACTESVKVANCIINLADTGEKKGNFRKRIEDSVLRLKELAKYNNRKNGNENETIVEILKAPAKRNPHSLGALD